MNDLLPTFFSAEFLDALANSWSTTDNIVRNLTYALLLLSVLMRNIAWLRTFAIASGTGRIIFEDPVTAFWELVLVAVNILQLLIIWLDNRKRNHTEEERRFLATFDPPLPNAAAALLLKAGYWHEAPAGSQLTVQGQPVDGLIYLSEGEVRIEAGGRAVASCGVGDFLGEMTWQSGKPATGSAIATETVRYLRFDRRKLEKLLKQRPVLQFALQTSFNRNLIAKLVRANETAPRPA